MSAIGHLPYDTLLEILTALLVPKQIYWPNLKYMCQLLVSLFLILHILDFLGKLALESNHDSIITWMNINIYLFIMINL